jgi:hypothetical protein
MAQERDEVSESAVALPAVASSEGVITQATKETRGPSNAAHLQAEDRFEQVIGLNNGCQQSLPLLQGPGRGPATDINGLFYWVLEDSLILHEEPEQPGWKATGHQTQWRPLMWDKLSPPAPTGSPWRTGGERQSTLKQGESIT